MMRFIWIYSLLIGVISISGCSKQEANERNFRNVISKYIETQDENCLADSTEYPFHSWDLALADTNDRLLDLGDAIKNNKKDVIDRILNSKISSVDNSISLHSKSYSDRAVTEKDAEVDLEDITGKPTGKKFKVTRYEVADKDQLKIYHESLPREIPSGFEMNHVEYDYKFYNLRDNHNYKLKLLETVGLIKSTNAEQFTSIGLLTNQLNGMKFIHKQYKLTDDGMKFYRAGKGFCYGKQELESVEKWIGPKQLGEYQEVEVTYIVRTNNIAKWATRKEMQDYSDAIKDAILSKKKETVTLVLSNKGWELK